MSLNIILKRSLATLPIGSRALVAVDGLMIVRLLCFFLACFSIDSYAKEYSVETILRAGGEYDDNVRLAEDEISIVGLVVSPELNLGLRTERLDVALSTALDFARFDKSEYDSDDQDIALTSSYAFEYNVFKAAAQLKRDSTRTSEFSSPDDTGNVLDPGTGELSLRATRHEAQNYSLAWQHLLTEKQSVEFSATYSKADYQEDAKADDQEARFSDYDYAGFNASYSVALTDRTRLFTQLAVSRFDSNTFSGVLFDGREIGTFCVPGRLIEVGGDPTDEVCPSFVAADIQQDTFGMHVGVERVLTEKLLFSVAVGANYVETSFDSRQADDLSESNELDLIVGLEDQDDTAFFFDSTLRYEAERTTLSLNMRSNTDPSANGYLLLNNQLSFITNYRLTERSNVFANLILIDSGALGDAVDASGRSLNSNDRTYGAASVGASYRLTEAWYVEASYRFRAQDSEFTDDIAKSNALLLKIAYKPHKSTWSR